MKKRYKKYNPIKFVQLNNERILKGFAGWIGKPSGREFEPEELYNIFDKIGAW